MGCQALKTLIESGTRFMPSASHAGPYAFNLVLYAFLTLYPAKCICNIGKNNSEL